MSETQKKHPDFFILGAPKCGTTALYEYLNDRDDIFMPSGVKEPNFFASDLNVQTQLSGEESYYALFKDAQENQLIGEASVWHLYSKEAAANIITCYPSAKFIVMLRNPIEMFISLHAQMLYSLYEDESDLEKAWSLQDGRKNGDIKPTSYNPEIKTLLYKDVCSLGAQLEQLYNSVPKAQVLVLFQEDMKRDTKAIYDQTIDFLGLPQDGRSEFPVINDRKEHKSSALVKMLRILSVKLRPLKQALRKHIPNMPSSILKPLYDLQSAKSEKPQISEAFKKKLLEEFEADIQIIEKLTGRDLAHWRAR